MVKIKDFLLQNKVDFGTYALVTYNNHTEAVWFTKHYYKGESWFLESPCELWKMAEVDKPIDEFTREYVDGLLEDGANIEDYIDKYVIPMIIDGILYEIKNFQCSPYLPDDVDSVKLITERECLEYLLQQIKQIK